MSLPDSIESMATLQALIQQGFTDWGQYGEVIAHTHQEWVLFAESPTFQQEGNWFEQQARGLILHRQTGEVVARPFEKMFNWLQFGRRSAGHIVSVTEKLDGSLGILYRQQGDYAIATRDSFQSDPAQWATAFLRANYALSNLPTELTLLFEIIYPANRKVVDYGGREDLVLLAARNRFTGDYLPLFPDVYELGERYGFKLPSVYHFNNLTDILTQTGIIDAQQEGWVVEFSDGQRFKFKGDEYLEHAQKLKPT